MTEPVGTTWYTISVEDWQAGDGVRETKLLQQMLENLQYLKTQVDSISTSEFWTNRWLHGRRGIPFL